MYPNLISTLHPGHAQPQYGYEEIRKSLPTREEAAAALFISKRTLARRLLKEGSSYRQIRDRLLSQQACIYLRNSQISVDAIASLLNYHDSANFRRAFKRWFNLSPHQYRLQAASEAATVDQSALH